MNAENEIFEVTPEPTPVEPVAPGPASEAATQVQSVPPQPLTPADERLWAMLAHLSVLLNLVTGFLGVVAALIIYMLYRDR